jgi:hypothetical protein
VHKLIAVIGVVMLVSAIALCVVVLARPDRRKRMCTEPWLSTPYIDIDLLAGGPPQLLVIEPCGVKRGDVADVDMAVVPAGVECHKQTPAAGKASSPWVWLCQAEGDGPSTGALQASIRLTTGRTVQTPPFVVRVITGTVESDQSQNCSTGSGASGAVLTPP